MPKVVPRLAWVWYWSAPPCFSTMRAAMERPRPVPRVFGGEERVEQPLLDFRRDAFAGVGDFQDDDVA